MRFIRWLALFAAFVAAAPALAAPALPAGVTRGPSLGGVSEYALANGLRVLLVPDESQDTITVNVTYLVGSRHEGYGESGMAHLLEHLVFKGTPTRPDIKAELTKRGARYNGTTSYDRTNYFETFPATPANLAWALELEADRMVNSNVSRKDLESEMTVVRNEFESGENSPFRVLRQRVAAAAYDWHNYGRAIIGTRSDIENVPIERLQAFYRKYYQPDNAVLVIAGRFDEAQALKLVADTFGRIPRPTRKLEPTYTREPTQDGERTVTVRRVGNVQIAAAQYHVPPATSPDYAAVDLAIAILSDQASGRLHKALVETGKASNVFGDDRPQPEAGSAFFGASVREDAPLPPVLETLIATVEGFGAEPATVEEVERARTQALKDIDLLLRNSRSLAVALSEPIALGDWRLLFWYRDRLAQVTRDEVQRAAVTYFKPANRTVGLFIPTKAPDRAEIPPPADTAKLLDGFRPQTEVAAGEAFVPTPANIEARVIRRTLPSGMRLALLPKKTRGGAVVASLALRWGDEASRRDLAVACGMASALLPRGTAKRTRAELRDELDRLRANVSVSVDGAGIDTVRESLPGALALAAEMLRQPSFPPQEFEQVRRAALTGLDGQKSDPSALAGVRIARHLNPYPPEHWLYTPTLEEREQRIKAVTLDDVRRCHAQMGAQNAELAVVGDFDPDEVTRLAETLFGDWKSPVPYARIPARRFEVAPIDAVIETPDKANAVYRAGLNLRLRDDDPDYPALVLGNYLLGGSSDSRLWRRIREKEGLSYSVGSWLTASPFDEVGEFGVSAIYAPQNRTRIESIVREEIAAALAEGFTHEEVEAAKKGLLEARQVARTQDATVAGRLNTYLWLGRTFQWDADFEARLAALGPNEVRDALARHLSPARLSVVKAGDFTRLAGEGGAGKAN
ncbi:MAG: insulinase family protein [Burkholderiales bacterium]|nr:insulinase family protein [Burkholderiales bacterium]